METQKLQLLARAMQVYRWRMTAITSNISNLDKPGNQRLSVSFEEELQKARQNIQGPNDPGNVHPTMQV